MTAVVAVLFASCQPQEEEKNYVTIDFDEVTLPECGYINQEPYVKEGLSLRFGHSYTYYEEWGSESWSGFAVSHMTDTETPGYTNQYSVMAGAAASGENFVVFTRDSYVQENNEIAFTDQSEHRFKSLALCNGSYPYLSMKEGDMFAKQFTEGDWFKLTITAYDANALQTDSMEVYLADFRQGKNYLPDSWQTIDLTSLGAVNKLSFAFSSSDVGMWGMNTPAYVCIDNIIYEE